MAKRIWVPILMLSMTCAFFIGGYVGQKVYEPKVVYVPVGIPVETVKWKHTVEIKYVEAEPIVEYVEVPQAIRNFESTEELEEWLEGNHIDHAIMLYTSGKKYDCDDYALRLIKDARKDGYQMLLQMIYHPYRKSLTQELASKKGANHAICSVIIGNNLYFVEQQTDEYWLVAKVD